MRDLDERLCRQDDLDAMVEGIRRLRWEDRVLVLLCCYGNCPLKKLGRAWGMSGQAMAYRRKRALGMLRERIRQER